MYIPVVAGPRWASTRIAHRNYDTATASSVAAIINLPLYKQKITKFKALHFVYN